MAQVWRRCGGHGRTVVTYSQTSHHPVRCGHSAWCMGTVTVEAAAPYVACVGDLELKPKLQVLVVEKDPELVECFREELAQFGTDVKSATDLSNALSWIEGSKLDAVLVGLDDTALDACGLISRVRHSTSNGAVPVIAMAHDSGHPAVAEASRAGASHFLTKPIVWTRMRQLVLSLQWRMVDERRHYRRANVDFPVLCFYVGGSSVTRCRNLSSRGMLVDLPANSVSAGAQVRVEFPHAGDCPPSFAVEGVVRRRDDADPPEIAIEFSNADTATVERLRLWVDLFVYFEGDVPSRHT